jgi:hypothetical protein
MEARWLASVHSRAGAQISQGCKGACVQACYCTSGHAYNVIACHHLCVQACVRACVFVTAHEGKASCV